MSTIGSETRRMDRPIGRTHVGTVIREVYRALEEKGYDPVSQMVGYLLSGDPTYITSYAGARSLIRTVDRHEILEELVAAYVDRFADRLRVVDS